MKHLTIIKETEDLREGRNKKLKVGTSFTCTDELANKYLKKKLAKKYEPDIKPINNIITADDAERFEEEKKDKK